MKFPTLIEITPNYTCRICGKTEISSKTYRKLCASEIEVKAFKAKMKFAPGRAGMPEGWLNNIVDGIVCDKCKELI